MLLIPTGGQQSNAYGTFAQFCLRIIHQVPSHYLILHQMFLDDVSTMRTQWDGRQKRRVVPLKLSAGFTVRQCQFRKNIYLFQNSLSHISQICLFFNFFCTVNLSLPVKRLPCSALKQDCIILKMLYKTIFFRLQHKLFTSKSLRGYMLVHVEEQLLHNYAWTLIMKHRNTRHLMNWPTLHAFLD